MDLDYDTPERPDGSAGDTKFYAVVWDQIQEQYLYYRKRRDNVLFGGSADLKERCATIDLYTDRLPDRKAHQLRSVVEVAIQCQFPSQAFIVGVDPRTSKRERQPTPEETAAYNWIRRIMAKEDAAWDPRAEKRLHAKLARLLTEGIRWTAADLIHRCRKQIPELGSQLSIAEGFGDTRATIIAGPACGAGILMGVLEEIAETIGGEWDQSYDHVDLLPGSRVQLTRLAFETADTIPRSARHVARGPGPPECAPETLGTATGAGTSTVGCSRGADAVLGTAGEQSIRRS
jgi:hypothetical protein